MKLHCFQEPPPPEMGEALERFEAGFRYPLGDAGWFRISHGRDYLPFFQAIGEASLLVAEQAGEVVGTLVRVERWITFQTDPPVKQRVHYLGDLKVSPQARGGRVLAMLMTEAKRQIEASGSRSCYGIVMGGTGRLPVDYTGRVGIPGFQKLGEIAVLRISALPPDSPRPDGNPASLPEPGKPACLATGGRSEQRSLMVPQPLENRSGTARGLLEDTRAGKRLWMEPGGEMLSAHLSGFRYETPEAGAEVIRTALGRAGKAGLPAVFGSVPAPAGPALRRALADLQVQNSPAAVFGYGIKPGYDWWVDTAEI